MLVLVGSALHPDGDDVRTAHLSDLVHTVEMFCTLGAAVTLATRDGARIALSPLSHIATIAAKTIDESEYDALVVLDGSGTCADLRDDPAFAAIVRRFARTPRPLAAIGSAIEALARVRHRDGTPLVRGRRIAASLGATADRLRDAGAVPLLEPVDAEHVTVDGYLVTAANQRSALVAARIVIAYLALPLPNRQVRAS